MGNNRQSSKSRDVLRIGTRRSALAKAQTEWVVDKLTQLYPRLRVETIEVITTGDKILDSSLNRMPGKGVFVKEIEDRLLDGHIDLAVHSMKDLPTEFPEGLILGAITERLDPRDVFITRLKKNLEELPEGSKIGTSSLRRKAQLLAFRPDFEVVDIRGNIDTRLKKADTLDYDGIILAAAGLARMDWLDRVQQFLGCEIMIPAVGQGALGIEIREEDAETQKLVKPLNDQATEITIKAERELLEAMGGGCQTPMGAFCRVRDGQVVFQAFSAREDGSDFKREKMEGTLSGAVEMAKELARRIQEKSGVAQLL
ncbi:MAG: hydroxymethylbilane synthase [bacterium]